MLKMRSNCFKFLYLFFSDKVVSLEKSKQKNKDKT